MPQPVVFLYFCLSMVRLLLSLLFILLLPVASLAQTPSADSLQRDVKADPRVKTAVNKHINTNVKSKSKGYRVQLYSGVDQDKAKSIRSKFLNEYGKDANAYIVYDPPNFKLRVGDFRTRLEAYRFLKKIKADFPSAYIVETEIEKPEIR
jgi:hypothetical protein